MGHTKLASAKTGVDVLHILFGGFSGQLSVVSDLSAKLRERGFSSSACLYAPRDAFADHVISGSFDDLFYATKHGRLDVHGQRSIGHILRETRPRVVLWHSHYGAASLAKEKRHRKVQAVVVVEHTPAELRTRWDDIRSLLALGIASGAVFQSQTELDGYRLRRLVPRLVDASVIIPNGVDTIRFRPRDLGSANGVALRLGMATRMVAQKDFETLIRAVSRLKTLNLPEFLVTLVGDGPDRPRLEQLSRQLGLQEYVHFTGAVNSDEVPELLRRLDVYVHTTFGESVGMALLEAYATGLPIVTSDVSGVNNMVVNGTDALLVPSRDELALADRLAELIGSPSKRRSLGLAARQRAVDDFSSQRMTERYLALFAELDPDGPWRETR